MLGKIRLLFAIISLTCSVAFAQSRLDSLREVSYTHSRDTLGVLVMADLCYEYRFVNQDSALAFGLRGIELATRLNFRTGLAQVLSDAALIYYDRAEFSNALAFWERSLAIREDLHDKPRAASLLLKLGSAAYRMGNYDEALKFQLGALRMYEELKHPVGLASALNNVAAVYEAQEDLDNALIYYRKALELHKSDGSGNDVAISTINIGNVHFRREEYNKAKRLYANVISAMDLSAPGAKHYLGIAYNNLSEIAVLNDKFDSAKILSQRSLVLRREIGDSHGVISSLNMLGRIESKLGNYAVAEKHFKTALDSLDGSALRPEEARILLNLYEMYRARRDWKNSLDAFVNYTTVRDSMMSEKVSHDIADLRIAYETEQKEQRIALQEAELAESKARLLTNYVVISALAFAVVLLIIIFLLVRSRHARRLEISRQEKELALRDAYIRATIESQEDERKRIARDLHDGMGQWISSLRLALNQIQQTSDDERKLQVIEQTDKIMDEMGHEFRRVAFNLMPTTLIRNGLVAATEEMATRLNQAGNVVFKVSSFEFPERLTELEEVSLYRIIQEWTNNILKYARATRVTIQFTGHADDNIIMIEDNGRGFDTSVLNLEKGHGWKNIQSRIRLIHGMVEIDSDPARSGSTFTITTPPASQPRAETVVGTTAGAWPSL